jgi:predicted AlkP superfamily phosphohydrolase/phosphomutase
MLLGVLTAAAVLATLAAAPSTANAAEPRKVLVVGFDGMDPVLLEQYRAAGLLPNLDRVLAQGWVRDELGTTIPPQSPVAWSTFITGLNPGGHGIFDFIHRDPEGPTPFLSTSEARAATDFWKLLGWKVPRGEPTIVNRREGAAFWQLLDAAGVDATVFKVPANFPPVDCEARTLSGMGTPDILGTYGIFQYFTDDHDLPTGVEGGNVVPVALDGGRFTGSIPGPRNAYREGDPETEVPFEAVVDRDNGSALFRIGGDEFVLRAGEWSDWVSLDFEMVPLVKSVAGICRFHLIEAAPVLRLYVTPVQIDPRNPEMPISTPGVYSAEVADAVGPYYTQGLPEDTKALDEGILDDHSYAQQSDHILAERLAQFRYELDRFARLDAGFLFFYFNLPDQSCHMYWRSMDPESPTHAHADPRYAHRIQDVYVALDGALGRLADEVDRSGDDTLIMVMSDHGFAPYRRDFHANTWLLENGYLALKPGVRREDVDFLSGVDWRRTRAYALGINGIYLNLRGREKNGIVRTGEQQEKLLAEICAGLEAAVDPEVGRPAVKIAYRTDQVYAGDAREHGPDIVVGYHRGWRGSNESALGAIAPQVFADNLKKWSGDHCIAADEVPGVILTNRPLTVADPSLLDMAPTILRRFGLTPPDAMEGRDIFGR